MSAWKESVLDGNGITILLLLIVAFHSFRDGVVEPPAQPGSLFFWGRGASPGRACDLRSFYIMAVA